MALLRVAGGRVLTPDFAVERADVLIDQDEGVIREVDPHVGDADDRIDADGCLVMPGLINGHTHIAMTLLRGYADDAPVDTWLEDAIWPVEAAMTPEDIRAGAELGILEMIKSGTTTFCDMYFSVDEIAAAVTESGIRARLGYGMITTGKAPDDAKAELEYGLTVAEELAGAANGRISTAYMPHSLTTIDLEAIQEILPKVRQSGYPVHYHANESAAFIDPILEQFGVRPLARATSSGLLELGDFVAHAVHVTPDEIDLLAEHGVGVIHCPASNMKLASGMAPVAPMRTAGIAVGIGTDGPASNNDLDMFGELRTAALLGKLASDDASAVPAEVAIRMATAEGADAIGVETGRLVPGAPADLAVVDLSGPHLHPPHDLVSHLAYAARGSDVRHTICNGQILMRDRECLTLDESAVIERASLRASALIDRAIS